MFVSVIVVVVGVVVVVAGVVVVVVGVVVVVAGVVVVVAGVVVVVVGVVVVVAGVVVVVAGVVVVVAGVVVVVVDVVVAVVVSSADGNAGFASLLFSVLIPVLGSSEPSSAPTTPTQPSIRAHINSIMNIFLMFIHLTESQVPRG